MPVKARCNMKIFICSSKHHYNKIPEIKKILERDNHTITLPNSFDNPFKEEELKKLSPEEHKVWKSKMLLKEKENIMPNDAILVLNYEKNGPANYIGGATFLEIFKAFELGKKIFFINSIPEGMLKDELTAISPVILNGNLELIK